MSLALVLREGIFRSMVIWKVIQSLSKKTIFIFTKCRRIMEQASYMTSYDIHLVYMGMFCVRPYGYGNGVACVRHVM